MSRILWMSDTPFRASGFGIVTGEICKRLAGFGYDILILGWWSRKVARYFGLQVEPCPSCPAMASAAIAKHVADFQPNYLVTLGDVPWLSYLAGDAVQKVLSRDDVKWFIYYPVDAVLPDGGLPATWAKVVLKADTPVTMSKFGVDASARSGISATLIPHGCDTQLFCPPPNKHEAKRRLGYEGKFVILTDARNHRRKLLPRSLDIVRRVKIPADRLVFHLHTNTEPQEDTESYSYDVRADIDLLGLRFATGLRDSIDPAGLSMRELAALYSAADVHLLTSYGEGFGLPTLQAASAGVVPIAPANSASTELIGSHGFAIPCDSSATDEFGLVREFVDRRQTVAVLEELYRNPGLLHVRSEAARNFALTYNWDGVVERWDALLRERRQMSPHLCRRSPNGQPRPLLARPIAPDVPEKLARRPSGHDESVLPVPWIGVPTRLDRRRRSGSATTPSLVLAEVSYVERLLPLERLFPGVRVQKVSIPGSPAHRDLFEFVGKATLVVDPTAQLRPKLDLFCAVRGVSFLGKSRFWPPVSGRDPLLQARLLLTDYALSEARVSTARARADSASNASAT